MSSGNGWDNEQVLHQQDWWDLSLCVMSKVILHVGAMGFICWGMGLGFFFVSGFLLFVWCEFVGVVFVSTSPLLHLPGCEHGFNRYLVSNSIKHKA